jgi:hypothetical protein
MSSFGKILKRLKNDRATVFLEYALLLAFVVVVGCMPIMPGGPLYDYLHKEIVMRVLILSLPFF